MTNRSKPQATSATSPVVLITGAARRIGATIATQLHLAGFNIVVHCNRSTAEADALVHTLNEQRDDSALRLCANLSDTEQYSPLIERAAAKWGRLDGLVNNASSFYPTPVGDIRREQVDDLFATNFQAPLFLSQAAIPHLRQSGGSIVNIVDIHADRPMGDYPIYSAAKAALASLTKGLAKDLGPEIRVNGISPGAILWPEHNHDPEREKALLEKTVLGRAGRPEDIAAAVHYFLGATYVTGQILAVDGGRSLST